MIKRSVIVLIILCVATAPVAGQFSEGITSTDVSPSPGGGVALSVTVNTDNPDNKEITWFIFTPGDTQIEPIATQSVQSGQSRYIETFDVNMDSNETYRWGAHVGQEGSDLAVALLLGFESQGELTQQEIEDVSEPFVPSQVSSGGIGIPSDNRLLIGGGVVGLLLLSGSTSYIKRRDEDVEYY